MRKNDFKRLFPWIACLVFYNCSVCIAGGELVVKEDYVYNKCGLLNGVLIKEITVDSFQNRIPTKFTVMKSALLYRQEASPNNDPKKLYFDKDCKESYVHSGAQIVDTLKVPIAFKKDMWYVLADEGTEVFMFIDKSGDRRLFSQQKLKVNY